ncbi:MAG TPA: hypothetical protein VE912_04480 [Bacteroidales bacterium]|nr:hypothetical protein [Bacteroidales bacterium]
MNTPVLFLIFNRPDTTKKVFEQIRKAQPPKLYVAADGPRKDQPNEEQRCKQVRQIATNVDWECEIKTLFRNENLGCKYAVSRAIDWFFENEEMGIILEDDCFPSESFFRFCEILLKKYRHDSRIMHINGNNYGADETKFSNSNFSYHFGCMPQVWGWATWSRAWNEYDLELENYSREELYNMIYWDCFFKKEAYKKRQFERWDQVKNNKVDTWDYQWQYAVLSASGFCVVPKKNLVSNIGFGENATHTKDRYSYKDSIDIDSINLPLEHPSFVIPDKKVNYWYQENMLASPSILLRIENKIKSLIELYT